ncbi:MAG: DUF3352 domain-containing protein [Cyanobacteria bacterium REEB459]|nr:DUF3352 domain-containing protein [Cyanobacteria bacterium REEB459]
MVLLPKKLPIRLLLGSVLLVMGVGTLSFWVITRRGGHSQTLPPGMKAIPANAVMVMAFSPDNDQWQRLLQSGNATTQAQLNQIIGPWRDRLVPPAALKLAADLGTGLGSEITLALVPGQPSNSVADQGPEANLMALVPIQDGAAVQQRLETLLEPAKQIKDNPYRGVTIKKIKADQVPSLYVGALNPNLALVSAQLDLLKQSIDTFRQGPSLADRPGLAQAFDQLPSSPSLVRGYLDVPTAVTTLGRLVDPPLPVDRLAALQAPRSLVGAISLKHQQIHGQALSWVDQQSPGFNPDNQASQIPQRLPASTLLMMSTGNLQKFWDDFKAGRQLSALFPLRPEDLTLALQSATGLNLEQDVLPWMNGEFGLGILAPPDQRGQPSLPNPALVLMAKSRDRDTTTASFNRLNQVMAKRYRFAVDSSQIEGVPVTRWTSPFDSLSLAYGWLPGDIVFLSVGQGVADLVVPRPQRSLAQARAFQAATRDAPRPNNGHFFINLEDLAKVQNHLLLPPLPAEGLFSAAVVRSLGVTATVISDRQVRYDLELDLK